MVDFIKALFALAILGGMLALFIGAIVLVWKLVLL